MFNFKTPIDLKGYTLIIPSVSVGNVPQLTVDLLITTYNFTKAATIWHPAIVPSVGGDPFASNPQEICTSCELYLNQDLKLALIQLRSALESKLARQFFNDLKESISKFSLKNVLILCSAFDYEMHQISNEKFFYMSNEGLDDKVLKIKLFEPSINSSSGSGFGVQLYKFLKDHFNCTMVLKYVSEGDNRPDALATMEVLKNVLNVPKKDCQPKFPSSWQFVFGGPPPIGIY